MRPELMAGFVVDQSKDQTRLPPGPPDRADQMISRRSGLPPDGNPGARQRQGKVVGKIGRDLEMFRSCLYLAEGQPSAHRETAQKKKASPRAPRRTRSDASASGT